MPIKQKLNYYWQLRGVKPTAVSFLIILVVWLIAPYVAFAGRAPFEHLWLRMAVTLAVILVWIYYGVKYFRKWYKKYQTIRAAEKIKIQKEENISLSKEDKEKLKDYL